MEARSIAKYVRVSPRKAGQVCSLVRGKNVDEALAILKFTPRGAADIIAKVVKSAKATAKYVRVSARKAGQICDLVRGKNVDEALAILKFTPREAASIIAKVVASAKANAENNHEMDTDKLYIASIVANQGPTMKRYMPRAQGRACEIRKRTSHIEVVLKEK